MIENLRSINSKLRYYQHLGSLLVIPFDSVSLQLKMKSRFSKIVSVFLGAIILISSNGIVLASHNCFSKPGTEVSLFEHKGCCSKGKKNCHAIPVKETAFTKKCCQLTISFHQADVSSLLVKTSLIHVDYFTQNFSIPNLLFSKNYSETLFFKKTPPKPAGRTLLSNISILLI